MECIKEDRPELVSWIDNQIMIPRANTYFVEGACLQFICPSCIYGKMGSDGDKLDEAKGSMNALANDMSQFRAELASGLTKTDGAIEMLAKLYTESTAFMAAKMDKLNELIEDSKNHTISELAAQFSKNDAASYVTNNRGTNKRPRYDDNLIDMAQALDLSLNLGNTEGHTDNLSTNQVGDRMDSTIFPTQVNSANENENCLNRRRFATDSSVPNEHGDISRPSALQTVNGTAKLNENEHMHEVFVSKFHPNESEERILQHIALNVPGVDKGEFRVRKLISSKMAGNVMQYVSFRISTNNGHIYKELLNPQIWPNAIARPYVKNKLKAKNPKVGRSKRPDKREVRSWNRERVAEPQNQWHLDRERPARMLQPNEGYQPFQQQYQIPQFAAVYPPWYGNNTGNRPFLCPQMNSAFPPMNSAFPSMN